MATRIKLIREYKGMPAGSVMQVTDYLADRLYNNGFCEDYRPAVAELKKKSKRVKDVQDAPDSESK